MTAGSFDFNMKSVWMGLIAFIFMIGLTLANATIAFGEEDEDEDDLDDDNGEEIEDLDEDEDEVDEDEEEDEEEEDEEGDELPETATSYPMGLLFGALMAGLGAFMLMKRRQTA
ncbi:LPXTG cell wall anchor domain-containing protein [Salsuginibacillus kocurii]|uniref:LPXTG cell wall anchor domain-containing protein n=1 Tax=Salsuginibacillus kocurii TaxID=427078 RepID=UPI00039B0280|nr:Loki-CTERM sorting domain-containing protein [Salsuginibacillus kocurii]